MSRLLSAVLDAIGRFPHRNVYGSPVSAAMSGEWTAAELFRAWSPMPESPWFPFAKATLFASIDDRRLSPPGWTAAAPLELPVGEVRWAGNGAVIADLPADHSVVLAAFFAERHGYQPVPLFNNWPHVKGLVSCEPVVSALLSLGAKRRGAAPQTGMPFFMIQSERLDGKPLVDDFDNRYFMSDEDFPDAAYFKAQGIKTVYYLHTDVQETDDLNPYFCALLQAGIELRYVLATKLLEDHPFSVLPRKTFLKDAFTHRYSKFHRAAAGGFGALIAPQSSGG